METKNECVKIKGYVFSRGKIRNRAEFYFGENKLDVVDHYKYSGLNFKFNGKFTVAKKELYDKGNRAMFSWAHEGTDILKKLHLRVCKYVLV